LQDKRQDKEIGKRQSGEQRVLDQVRDQQIQERRIDQAIHDHAGPVRGDMPVVIHPPQVQVAKVHGHDNAKRCPVPHDVNRRCIELEPHQQSQQECHQQTEGVEERTQATLHTVIPHLFASRFQNTVSSLRSPHRCRTLSSARL